MKKALNIFLLILITLLLLINPVIAHGGEDHGDEEGTPATSSVINEDVADSELFATDEIEALVKYPAPHVNERSLFQVFITDFRTNQPVSEAGVSLSLVSNASGEPPLKVQAAESDIPGVYQAEITFEKTGSYRASLEINKETVKESFTIQDVSVESIITSESTGYSLGLLPFLLIALVILFLTAVYFYTRTVRKLKVKDAA